jgi:uncharacterized protein (TIGR02594 family)
MKIWTPIDVAALYLGKREVIGPKSDPSILAMLTLDSSWPTDDATPWCAAFANWCAFHAGYQRSRSLRARSWLLIGRSIWTKGDTYFPTDYFRVGDVLVFARGRGRQPGPEVIKAAGHVGFFTGLIEGGKIEVLGGNQGDKVSQKMIPISRLLAVRRLARDSISSYLGTLRIEGVSHTS